MLLRGCFAHSPWTGRRTFLSEPAGRTGGRFRAEPRTRDALTRSSSSAPRQLMTQRLSEPVIGSNSSHSNPRKVPGKLQSQALAGWRSSPSASGKSLARFHPARGRGRGCKEGTDGQQTRTGLSVRARPAKVLCGHVQMSASLPPPHFPGLL